ncbi:DUF1653 domain-containing protein [Butyrivibrio sp. AE3003]|uniref:DUF1653 domain-containing protein n=1 Tax=Butyrivibrio sp. AE3003 TaxID=1496721 RepID=UPI0009DD91C9
MYQIVTIAIHSETREEMVVYQALYGDYSVYCRPLSMFMSEVDREKYPDVEQRFRFEKVDRAEKAEKADTDDFVEVTKTTKTENEVDNEISEAGKMSDEKKVTSAPKFKVDTSYERSEVMEKSIDDEARDLNLDPLVIKFLDADLASEKNDILCKLHPIITNDMIDIMAMSVGVVINEGDVDGRYNDLRNCLTTMEKYESTRLRS